MDIFGTISCGINFYFFSGAELLFTSDEVASPTDNHVAIINSVDAAAGIITLEDPLPKNLTSVETLEARGYSPMYAVEVALLTRRVIFEPNDNSDFMGGHTIIFHTPHVAQNIKGIEFRRFGQRGLLGRYPLHCHMSESVFGSTVTKNLVRESNQRCYVVHGTHNLTLIENIAFDTFGHCL